MQALSLPPSRFLPAPLGDAEGRAKEEGLDDDSSAASHQSQAISVHRSHCPQRVLEGGSAVEKHSVDL